MIGKLIPLRRAETEGEISDGALLAACAAGDAAALAVLFDRHCDVVHRFLARLAGVDEEAVDDLVQDVFLQAFSGAARYRRGAAVRTWLLGIAVNLARHHVRSDIRRRARGAVFLARFASEPATPAANAERDQLVERLGDALRSLPQALRAVFLMCDVEEVRGIDAARALGLREGTLYRRLHEARRALRRALEGPR